MNNNPNTIGVIGPMASERSIRDQQMQREFGSCNSTESYCARSGVGAGNMIEPRSSRDQQMLSEFNTCGVRENYCGYASNSMNANVMDPYARINDNPYLPNGGRVEYVPLQ